jgi:hypothetical protein
MKFTKGNYHLTPASISTLHQRPCCKIISFQSSHNITFQKKYHIIYQSLYTVSEGRIRTYVLCPTVLYKALIVIYNPTCIILQIHMCKYVIIHICVEARETRGTTALVY